MVHSWNRIMNDSDSLQTSALKPFITSMEAMDPHTFRVDLKAPKVDFMDTLHNFVFTSEAHFDKLGKEQADKTPVGTGAFLFKEWVPGQRFVVTRNPSYWGQKPAADEVVTRYIPDAIARVAALNNGEIDIADSIPPHLVGQIGSRAKAASVDGQRHMFLVMRPDNPPLDNKLVRQAIYHAIDRTVIVERIQEGYATELKGPIASFIPGSDPTLPDFYPYDPAKAKALLAQAGMASGFSIDFTVPAGQWVKDKETGEAIAAMLKDVGITTNIKTPELPTYHSGYNEGKWGFYIVGRGSVLDPSGYLTQYFRTGSSRRVGYSNPELDKLLDADAGMTDTAARLKSLAQIQRMIMEDAPAVFLFTYKNVYGVANNIDWRPVPNEYIHGFNIGFKA
jgi:peptide/nickel transport system substrate-binding protein